MAKWIAEDGSGFNSSFQIIEVKSSKSKAQERKEIEQQTLLFLKSGGKVVAVERGVSGETPENRKLPSTTFSTSTGNRADRTPLTAEIQAIEARRESMRQRKSRSSRSAGRAAF